MALFLILILTCLTYWFKRSGDTVHFVFALCMMVAVLLAVVVYAR